MGLFRTNRNWAALFCRIAIAAIFIPHGMDKLVRYEALGWEGPEAWAAAVTKMLNFAFIPEAYKPILAQVSAWVEVVAAGSCVLGLLVRLAVIPLIGNMAVAIALVHWKNGFWINHTLDGIPAPGFEYCMAIILMCVGLFFAGAGSFSIDKLVGGEPEYDDYGDADYDYDDEDEYEDDPRERRRR